MWGRGRGGGSRARARARSHAATRAARRLSEELEGLEGKVEQLEAAVALTWAQVLRSMGRLSAIVDAGFSPPPMQSRGGASVGGRGACVEGCVERAWWEGIGWG